MKHHSRLSLLFWLAFSSSGAFSQEAPRDFQLYLPDFFTTPFDSSSTLIELPDRPLRRLSVLVVDAAKRNIAASGIRVWVNGKGIGNILDSRGVEQGTLLTMDPSTLNRRPDELFDPRENTIEISAADKRGRKYYQSWILRLGAARNSYFAYGGSVSPDDPTGVPPDLLLEEPRIPPVLAPGQASVHVVLKGTCASTHPSTALTLNGKPIFNTPAASAPFQQTVEVRRDTKELVLEATDDKHNRRSIVIPVMVQEKVAPKPHFAGTRYAVIIGISRYGDLPGAPPMIPSAAADAGELARQLETNAGFRKENIRLLVDDQATLGQIRTSFYDFAARAQGDDLLVIYVAGHGLHDPRPGNNDKLYLAPYGTQLAQIDSTALSFEDMELLLGRSIRSNHTFLIFDVGHQVSGGWKFPGRNVINNHLLNLFSEQEGRAVLVSGSADEISQERAGGQGSSFTYWLSRALAGDADLNQDRIVTAQETFRFISEKVRDETKGVQNPRYKLPMKTAETPLAEVSAARKP
ncbi:MAG: caspase family protein [Acidobacteriia bacterium]|nr:caspase family protein [Terriglobia bacterium]